MKIIWIWTCSQIFKKCSYGEDLLLFWMMVNIATTHSLKCCVFVEQELLQGDIINNNFDISLTSGMHILKEVCYMMTSFPVINSLYGRVIISREHLKWSICQGHCIYFTALAAVIHNNKRSVVDSRKFEGYKFSWWKPL